MLSVAIATTLSLPSPNGSISPLAVALVCSDWLPVSPRIKPLNRYRSVVLPVHRLLGYQCTCSARLVCHADMTMHAQSEVGYSLFSQTSLEKDQENPVVPAVLDPCGVCAKGLVGKSLGSVFPNASKLSLQLIYIVRDTVLCTVCAGGLPERIQERSITNLDVSQEDVSVAVCAQSMYKTLLTGFVGLSQ